MLEIITLDLFQTGSSPEILSISIVGNNFEFNENFELQNELQQTGISEYYTWSYDGMESFTVSESSQVKITINPNGNEMGSVTVDILDNSSQYSQYIIIDAR